VEVLETRLAPTVSFAAPQTFAALGGPILADFNGDGRPDLVGVDASNHLVSVSVNTTPNGSTTVSFAAPQTFAVESVPSSVAVADFNGDGKPDLAVVNGTLSIFLNTTAPGSSTVSFAAPVDFSLGSHCYSVTAGDLNGDGRPDVVVGNSSFNNVSVLLNTTATGATTPSFTAQQTFAIGSLAEGLAIADLNGDGKPDLAVANLDDSTVSVLVNTMATGASTPAFAAQQTFAVGSSPISVAVADFNGDGRPDLALSSELSGATVLLNTTTAGSAMVSFTVQQTFAAGTESIFVAAADLDGDGRPDLAVVNNNDGGPGSISILVNTMAVGATIPSFAAQRTIGAIPGGVAVGDFNGDGKPDLAIADAVFLNTTGSAPVADSQAVSVTPDQAKSIFLTGDTPTNDALSFVVTVNPSHGTLSGLNGTTGAVTYTPNAGYVGPDSFLFDVADAGSGLTSLAATVTLTVAPPVSFGPAHTFAAGDSPYAVAVADFNGDGKPDLVVTNFQGNTFSVFRNTTPAGGSTISFAAPQTFTAGNYDFYVVVADFNGDGKPDVAFTNDLDNTVSVLLNTTPAGASSFSFAPQQTFAVGTGPAQLAVADLNGDGRPDLVVVNQGHSGNTISVLLNTTPAGALTPSFAVQQTFAVGTNPIGVAVGDFNGDGRPDLAVTGTFQNAYRVSVLLNTTATGASVPSFVPQQTFVVGNGPGTVSVGDFNRDGRPDLVVLNSQDRTLSVLLDTTTAGATTASFAAQQTFSLVGSTNTTVADFNGSGLPDLGLMGGTLMNLTAAGATTASFAAEQTFTTSPSLSWLAVGDLNGDGRPDLVATSDLNNNLSVNLNTTGTPPPTSNTQSLAAAQGQPTAVTLSGSAPDSDPFTFAVAANPYHGTLSGFNPATAKVTYTPAAGYAGPDNFVFTVTDTVTGLVSGLATVFLNVGGPVANPQSATVGQGRAKVLTLSGSAPNNDPLSFALVSSPAHGTLSGLNAATGQVTYTPAAGYFGPDSFTFTVTDTTTNLTSAAATVGITVLQAPTANAQSVLVGQSVPITLTGSAPNGDAFTFTLTSQPVHGTLNGFNANTGTVTYTPAGTYAGTDRFAFTVTDTVTNLTSVPATVSLTVSAARALVAQFGNQGVWQYDRTTGSWAQLTPANATLLATDGNGDVAAEFPGYGLWEYQPSSGWQRLHSVDVSLLAMNAAGTIVVEFPGYGVGQYSPAAGWPLLTGANASLLAIDVNGDIAAEFPHYGVWEFLPSSGWQQLHTVDVTLLAMDPQGDVAANFPGYGVGEYGPAGGWRLLNGTQATSVALDAGGDLVAEFAGYGVGEYVAASGSWRALTAANATALAADAGGNFYGEFAGYGVWQYDPTRGWVQLRTTDAAVLAAR
jgi:hypothetical protein